MSSVPTSNPQRKELVVPEGFHAPETLHFEDLKAVPFSIEHVNPDLEAINSNYEFIRRTRGGTWPEGITSLEDNQLDATRHRNEFRDNRAFAYSVYNSQDEYIGFMYLYPIGERTELTPETIKYDVDMSFWTTESAAQRGYYEKLHSAANQWLHDEFPFFKNVYCSNAVIPQHEKTSGGTVENPGSWVGKTTSQGRDDIAR
ncbi:MAG TPA: hypothetical protein VFT64_03680 [Rickettsiales bacterium]|nr:hypothetical protein [Rickettsiales bacterium]